MTRLLRLVPIALAALVLAVLLLGDHLTAAGGPGSRPTGRPAGPGSPAVVWRWTPPEPGGFGEPAADSRHVAVVHGNGVTLLDRAGRPRWTASAARARYEAPLLTDELVVVAGQPDVAAYDRRTGAAAWSRMVTGTADGVTSTPVDAGGAVVVSTSDDQVVALDPATGDERWRVAVGERAVAAPAVAASSAGAVVVQSWRGGWAGLRVDTGAELWRSELPLGDTSPVAAVRSAGGWLAAVLDADGTVHAVDAITGSPRWTAPAGGPGSPLVEPVSTADGSLLVVTDQTAGVTVFTAARGELRWSARGTDLAVTAGPAPLSNREVVVPRFDGSAVLHRPARPPTLIRPAGIVSGVARLPGGGFVLATRDVERPALVAYRATG